MEFSFNFLQILLSFHDMISLSGSCISADQLLELLWGTSNINNKHCEKDSNPESDQNKERENIETREKSDYCNQQGMYAENRLIHFK